MSINARATQEFVPIKEVRDGVIILRDGSMRALLLASSINLSLKSADEQQAVIMQFQTFLNSLDFSVQIVVQSRKLDIKPYLMLLENKMKDQMEPLLKIQTREYISFIREFTEQVAIMSKQFIIVVPYSGGSVKTPSGSGFFGKKEAKQPGAKSNEVLEFEEKRSQLEQRISVVQQGLNRVGVRTVQIGTEEAIELFYKVFNPGETTTSAKLDK
jgi:type IV secretory pathway VirB4 component